jgi:hypothetical protein
LQNVRLQAVKPNVRLPSGLAGSGGRQLFHGETIAAPFSPFPPVPIGRDGRLPPFCPRSAGGGGLDGNYPLPVRHGLDSLQTPFLQGVEHVNLTSCWRRLLAKCLFAGSGTKRSVSEHGHGGGPVPAQDLFHAETIRSPLFPSAEINRMEAGIAVLIPFPLSPSVFTAGPSPLKPM